MSEAEFAKHRAALAAQRLEKPKRMAARASQLWAEITAQVRSLFCSPGISYVSPI
jgi:secreted Zn-dependent insulinase-like peptidase